VPGQASPGDALRVARREPARGRGFDTGWGSGGHRDPLGRRRHPGRPADVEDDTDRATASLTVDFLKPAAIGDWIEARTRVDRVGSTLAFADCSLTVEGREIVRSRAVWVVAG